MRRLSARILWQFEAITGRVKRVCFFAGGTNLSCDTQHTFAVGIFILCRACLAHRIKCRASSGRFGKSGRNSCCGCPCRLRRQVRHQCFVGCLEIDNYFGEGSNCCCVDVDCLWLGDCSLGQLSIRRSYSTRYFVMCLLLWGLDIFGLLWGFLHHGIGMAWLLHADRFGIVWKRFGLFNHALLFS